MKKIFMGLTLLLLLGCTVKEKSTKPTIFVSILPQKFFVEQIAGDDFEVEVMVPPGQSPATYEPTPQQMVALSNAVLYFKIGVQFEQSWMKKIGSLNPNMLIVDSAKGIKIQEMESLDEILSYAFEDDHDDNLHDDHIQHEGIQPHEMHNDEEEDHHSDETHQADEEHHSEKDKHHHEGHNHEGALDPHIWLSPELVKIQAQNILNSLKENNPEKSSEYDLNYQKFITELERLQNEIKQNLSNLKNRMFLVFHPSWGYFSQEFNLKQIPIEISGKAPTSKELAKIMQFAMDHEIKIIFVQKQFSKHEAEMIAENIAGTVVQIDPLAENYLENMRFIATKINNSLSE